MIVECCVCKRWKQGDEWIDVVADKRRFAFRRSLPAISHGFCEPCFVAYLQKEGFSEKEIAEAIAKAR